MNENLTLEESRPFYTFLIDQFGFKKIDEGYYPENFGNFFVVLKGEDFSLQYHFDRSVFTIEILGNQESDRNKWYSLYFIKDLIYNPDQINVFERKLSNNERIQELNSFVEKDFSQISDLFSKKSYPETKKKIDDGLRKSFFLRHPQQKK